MFCCKCLNISIKAKTTDLPQVDVVTLSADVLDSSDHFFKEDLVEAEIVSIAKEQPCLVLVRNVVCWIIHRCINCNIDTHALHRDRGAACVLINSKTLTDKTAIAELKSSPSYSPVFRLLVTSDIETDAFAENITDFHATGGLQTTLAALHQQLTEALQREAQQVEERVRQYSEKEYANLEEFRSKSHDDHRTLARLLMESQSCTAPSQGNIQSQAFPSRSKFISLPPPPQKLQLAEEDENRHPMAPLNQNTSRSRDASNRRHSNSKLNVSPLKTEPRPVPSVKVPDELSLDTADSEGLFQLDGMDENPPTTFHSEDETDTEADNGSSYDEGINISRTQSSISNLAKSLPVSVPIFPGAQHHGNEYEEDDPLPHDPMDIAASIKALARSVHGDTVFGDLPRPRFSSQI